MDHSKREFVSSDGVRWHYTIEHRVQDDGIAWRARVWEQDAYRGMLEGRVSEHGTADPAAVCSVALKMALDSIYMRTFGPDRDNASADATASAQDADAAPETPAGHPAEDPATDRFAGTDPLPSPA